MHVPPHQSEEAEARFTIEIAVEFFTREYMFQLRQRFRAGAHIAGTERFQQRLMRHGPDPQRGADQRAGVQNDVPDAAHRASCTSRFTSSSVNLAETAVARFVACALHASKSAKALERLRRESSNSSISSGETMKAAGRPCRVIATASRCTVSSNCPNRFCASTELILIIGFSPLLANIANLDNIANTAIPQLLPGS
jgi:hypothetical protein